MAQLWEYIKYLQDHPGVGLGLVAALIFSFYLLNRKPKLERELDRRLEELRKERGHYYDGTRPPE